MLLSLFLIIDIAVTSAICLEKLTFSSVTDVIITAAIFVGVYLGLIILHFLMLIIVSLLTTKKEADKPRRFYKFMVDNTVPMILTILGVSTEIKGLEKLPTDRRFLLVSNHLKNYDPMVLIGPCRKYNIAFVSKPENFKIPIAGAFVRQCSYMAIDRENPRNAMKTLHRATELIVKGNVSVGIYPEGTRSKTGELLEFKDGIFYVAKKAPCPIVVSTVKYEKRSLGRTKATVEILSVFEPQEFENLTTHEISDIVRNLMLENL